MRGSSPVDLEVHPPPDLTYPSERVTLTPNYTLYLHFPRQQAGGKQLHTLDGRELGFLQPLQPQM